MKGCHCDGGWICEAHPDQSWPHEDCAGPAIRCDNFECPWWNHAVPLAVQRLEVPDGSSTVAAPNVPPPTLAERIGEARLARVRQIIEATWSKAPPRYIGAAWILAGVATVVFGIWWAADFASPGSARFLILPFGLAAALLVRQGIRRLQPTFAELIQLDARKPIVYLREFASDGRSETNAVRMVFWNALSPGSERLDTFEEHVIGVIREVGPCVCLGRPSDVIPELGAARLYTRDEDWERVATLLLEDAQAAVFTVTNRAMSPALAHEWTIANRLLPKNRLFVLLASTEESSRGPRWEEGHSRFLSHTGLSEEVLSSLTSPLVVHFDSNGHPQPLDMPEVKPPLSYVLTFRWALQISGMPVTPMGEVVRAHLKQRRLLLRMLVIVGILTFLAIYYDVPMLLVRYLP